MADIYFLEAKEPLVKRFTLGANGSIEKEQYPANIKYFTSHVARCTTPVELYKAIVEHAKEGHCLIKGKIKRMINDEPRAGLTDTNGTTEWLCLDLDKAPFKAPSDLMDKHPLLQDVSYVVQYSASAGLPDAKGLSCHIYIMLSHPYHAQYIKAWLMQQNLDASIMQGRIRKAITLTESSNYLHYPVDITASQNDKLLYIGLPVVGKGIKYSIPEREMIQYVPKKLAALPIERLKTEKIDIWKKQARDLLNGLRSEAGLDVIKHKTKIVKDFEVQVGVGEVTVTGMRKARGYTYFNFNHGDSWAYYHPDDNPEYIHNFKGEPSYSTKEILPDYYKQFQRDKRVNNATPTDKGDLVLAICNKHSGGYNKVLWNEATKHLEVYPANTKDQLHDWLLSYGKMPPEFIDQYNVEFNPQNETIIDTDTNYLNLFVPSPWFCEERTPDITGLNKAPTIKRVLMSVASKNKWTDVTEHLVNWLACIFQYRIKTGTAWVFSGVEGTGKGTLVNHIITPLLGSDYVQALDMSVLEDDYNDYMERALIVSLDEVQISALNNKSKVASRLRSWITEPTIKLRKMRVSPHKAKNFSNFILSSNKDDPIIINNVDRRFNVAEFQTEKLKLTRKEIYETIPAELPYFFDYLMAYEADTQQAAQIITTDTRKAVIAANRNSLDILGDAINDGDIGPFVDALPDMHLISEVHATGNTSAIAVQYNSIITREMTALTQAPLEKDGFKRYESILTRDELWILFAHAVGNIPNSPHKFTKLLRHKRIETTRMRRDGEAVYGVKIKWAVLNTWLRDHTVEAPVTPSKTTRPLKAIVGGKSR